MLVLSRILVKGTPESPINKAMISSLPLQSIHILKQTKIRQPVRTQTRLTWLSGILTSA